MCYLLRLCQAVLVCLSLGLALHACACTQSSACRLCTASASGNAANHFRFQWPIRFQSQPDYMPDCPHALTVRCPRLRCTLTASCVLRLVSAQGNPLPTCTCPSQQGAGHCPRLDLMGQRQLDLLVLRRLTIGAEGDPPSNLPAPALHRPATTAALATTTPWS
jgi:hypothetical protein